MSCVPLCLHSLYCLHYAQHCMRYFVFIIVCGIVRGRRKQRRPFKIVLCRVKINKFSLQQLRKFCGIVHSIVCGVMHSIVCGIVCLAWFGKVGRGYVMIVGRGYVGQYIQSVIIVNQQGRNRGAGAAKNSILLVYL